MDATDGGPGSSEGPQTRGTAASVPEPETAGAPSQPETAGAPPQPETAGAPPQPETAGAPPQPETAGGAAQTGTGGDDARAGTAVSVPQPETAGGSAQLGAVGGAVEPGRSPGVRSSDRERDAVVQRIQQAFAEGRLDDTEFDERMRAALTARRHADLDVLLADLPAETAAPGSAPAAAGRGPGRVAVALKSSVRRGGRWRVPQRYTTVVYKGSGWLDLRAAELSGPATTFVAVAYKSRVTILVPPGVRVEMTGFGVTQGADEEDPGYRLPTDVPVIHVRGVAYKGTVEVTTRPPERPALQR